MKTYNGRLEKIESSGLMRKLLVKKPGMLEFSSNDYLGLANHPALKEASIKAIKRYGSSVASSRLMCGNIQLHEDLETRLARLTRMEAALLFGSGFLANVGLINCITSRDDLIFSDKLNHASLVDGARLSRARVARYKHCDMEHLEYLLSHSECRGQRYIVTDSLFSMDGDIAPLRLLEKLAKSFDCNLVVDEAHAIGVFGEGGGICREYGIKPHAIVGTLSKALGSYGGFVSCNEDMKKYLVNRARTFIYSTGLPPAAPAAALAAVDIIETQPDYGRILLGNASDFRCLLKPSIFSSEPSESQIVPIQIGDNLKALALADRLLEEGISTVAVRPPTVPDGTARVRLSVTLSHSREDLHHTADVLNSIGSEV